MKLENNLDTDEVRGLVWRLAIPSMLAQFVSVFYSIVDRMYIGNIAEVGGAALAGVGVCGPIITLISSAASWVGIGGAPLMSIRLGQKNEKGAREIVANCFALLTTMAFTIMFLTVLFKERLLWWFGASPTIFAYANTYMTWCIPGIIFSLLSVGMNQFIICQGFAKVGMKSVMLGAVCNILLDPVFIFWLDMGVKGAAMATVLSQMASCGYVLAFLFGKRPPVPITFSGYSGRIIVRVLTLGLSPFLIIASDSALIIVMNMVIRHYGASEGGDMLLTCNTIVQSFMLMVTMPLGGITGGTQTILGYNYGAGRPDRIRRAQKHILLLGLSFMGIMTLTAQLLSGGFVQIFTKDAAYIETSVWAIRMTTLSIMPLAVQYTIVDGFTGMGIAHVAVSLSMFRKFLYFTGMLVFPFLFGARAVFFAEPVSDLIGAVTSATVYMLSGRRILGLKHEAL